MSSSLTSLLPSPALDSEDDLDLVARAARQDDRAFEAIMRRHNRLLFRTARSILKSDAEAEDALQDAYVRAWRALPGFRADAKLSTWLVRIVTNEALGRLRRRGALVIPLDPAIDVEAPEVQMQDDPEREPERVAMRAEMRRLMEQRIDLLPAAYRSVCCVRSRR